MFGYTRNSLFEAKWKKELTEKERTEYVLNKLETLSTCSGDTIYYNENNNVIK